VATVY